MTFGFIRTVSRVLPVVMLAAVTSMVALNGFGASPSVNTAIVPPSVEMRHASLIPICPTSFTVNDNGDASDATPGDEVCATAGATCSLRAAIEEANALGSCGAIDINLSGVTSPISLVTELPAINHNVNLNGPGANLLTVMRSTAGGTPQFRVFAIQNSRTVTISGLTISNGNLASGSHGGGILNNGTLTLTNCNVFGNSVVTVPTNFGGGIYTTGPSLTLNNCKVGGPLVGQQNTATDGGGIYILSGTVVMTGGSVVGNSGGGIANVFGGNLTLNSVAVTNNIGGVNALTGGVGNAPPGTATIINCLIANNSAASAGGGFFNGGTATLINTTISGNSSAVNGGGIINQGSFINSNPTLSLINNTITNNRSDSNNSGGEQGGGIFRNAGTITLTNTIVAGNFAGTGSTADDVNGTLNSSSSFNLIGTGGAGGLINGTNNNQVGVANSSLGPLANNGGPTLTHALLVGSPAIDAGTNVTTLNGAIDNSITTINLMDASAFPAAIGLVIQIDNEQMMVTGKVSNTLTVIRAANGTTAAAHNSGAGVNPAFDQRGAGFPRIVNGRSDIGTYESHNLQVNSLADTDDGACTAVGTGNGCTLREAINAANTQTGTESITFAPALTSSGPAAITLLNALPVLSSDMMIVGTGANLLTVQRSTAGGTPNFRIFTVNTGKTVSIFGLTISRGNFNSGGAGIFVDSGSTVTLFNSTVSDNHDPNFGGGGISNSGTLTLANSTVSGNTGNGIRSTGTLTLTSTTVTNNVGSGIFHVSAFPLSVTSSTITGNSGGTSGGGIYGSNGGTVTVIGTTVSGNSANGGAGIFSTSNLVLMDTTVSGNNGTSAQGGGIQNLGTATLTNCTVTGNTSVAGGGGIFNAGSTITLSNSTVTANSASAGGGINSVSGTASLRNTIIAGNGPNDLVGTYNSLDYNLIGNTSGASFTGTTTHNITNVDALLSPLADNGGPTLTNALISGSPAIDAGNNSFVTNPPFRGPPFTDQRGGGFNRIADGDDNSTAIVDIGAYELQSILTIDKVSPIAGRTSGGQEIKLSGAFANLSTVTMGGASASWVYTNGAADTSAITVTTPAQAVGAVQIVLTPTSGSPYSKANAFAYLPTVFTDNTITVGVTTAKAQHIIELRQAVDALRAVAGLSPAPWTDATLTPFSTVIKAIHILELRSYLDDAATQLGYATSPYTDPSLDVGFTTKRIHIEELRQRIRTIAG